jgi:hypothetical protein
MDEEQVKSYHFQTVNAAINAASFAAYNAVMDYAATLRDQVEYDRIEQLASLVQARAVKAGAAQVQRQR